jgi:hypothetical protein
MKDQDCWILTDRESRSGRNGVEITILTFQNILTNQVAEMTLDPTYRNYHRSGWNHVVQHSCPWGIYQNLKLTARTTREGRPVLTADSAADIVYRCEDHAQAQTLAEHSRAMDQSAARYHDFFTA